MNATQSTWTDYNGKTWRTVTPRHRLRFQQVGPSTLRVTVFMRDAFRCRKCGERAINIPVNYDGRYALSTEHGRCLLLDHVVSLRNGGSNHPDNLQAYCDRCNRAKCLNVDRWGPPA